MAHQLNIQQRIQDREKDVKVLQQEVEAINGSADQAVEGSEKTFTELISLIQKTRSDVEQQLRSKQETEVSRVKDLQEKLEQEITELKTLSALSKSTDSSSINNRPLRYFEDVTAAVSEARDKLQNILTETWMNVLDVSLPKPQPKTRADFLKYAREITLDPNTAHPHLLLSEGNRKVTNMVEDQSYSDHPDRFTNRVQVLSAESLTGRCYWELEWRRADEVCMAVAYKTISRVWWSLPSEDSACEIGFGENKKSWALFRRQDSSIFGYNNVLTKVSGPTSSRIGVYLDHSAGILSFYDVSETMTLTLLHRVQTTFTQPLLVGVGLTWMVRDATAEFIKIK